MWNSRAVRILGKAQKRWEAIPPYCAPISGLECRDRLKWKHYKIIALFTLPARVAVVAVVGAIYWKPICAIRGGSLEIVVANAQHVKKLVSVLEKCLTPPTLSERRFCNLTVEYFQECRFRCGEVVGQRQIVGNNRHYFANVV